MYHWLDRHGFAGTDSLVAKGNEGFSLTYLYGGMIVAFSVLAFGFGMQEAD